MPCSKYPTEVVRAHDPHPLRCLLEVVLELDAANTCRARTSEEKRPTHAASVRRFEGRPSRMPSRCTTCIGPTSDAYLAKYASSEPAAVAEAALRSGGFSATETTGPATSCHFRGGSDPSSHGSILESRSRTLQTPDVGALGARVATVQSPRAHGVAHALKNHANLGARWCPLVAPIQRAGGHTAAIQRPYSGLQTASDGGAPPPHCRQRCLPQRRAPRQQ